ASVSRAKDIGPGLQDSAGPNFCQIVVITLLCFTQISLRSVGPSGSHNTFTLIQKLRLVVTRLRRASTLGANGTVDALPRTHVEIRFRSDTLSFLRSRRCAEECSHSARRLTPDAVSHPCIERDAVGSHEPAIQHSDL